MCVFFILRGTTGHVSITKAWIDINSMLVTCKSIFIGASGCQFDPLFHTIFMFCLIIHKVMIIHPRGFYIRMRKFHIFSFLFLLFKRKTKPSSRPVCVLCIAQFSVEIRFGYTVGISNTHTITHNAK